MRKQRIVVRNCANSLKTCRVRCVITDCLEQPCVAVCHVVSSNVTEVTEKSAVAKRGDVLQGVVKTVVWICLLSV